MSRHDCFVSAMRVSELSCVNSHPEIQTVYLYSHVVVDYCNDVKAINSLW